MKKLFTMLILIVTIFMFGCSINKNALADKKIELPYSILQAYENNDVIDIENGNRMYNEEKIEEFIKNIEKKKKDSIRIVSYHTDLDNKFNWDIPERVYDLKHDGKEVIFNAYATHKVPPNGKIVLTDSRRFIGMGKNISNEDVQYILIGKDKTRSLLSLVKNGLIDEETQKYLDSILVKK